MPICFLDSNLFIAVALEESVASEDTFEQFLEDETLIPVISSVVVDEVYDRVRFLKGRMAAWQATQFIFRLPRLRLVSSEQFSPLLPEFQNQVKDPDEHRPASLSSPAETRLARFSRPPPHLCGSCGRM